MDVDRWRSTTLGEIVNLKRGYDLPKRLRGDGYFPIVSSSGVTGTHSEPKVEPPGVVTGRYGTLGTVHYIEQPFWPLNTTLYVQDFKGNHERFVAYLLESLNLSALVSSAAVPGINRNHLHPLQVHVPDWSLQASIAEALGLFDDLIENNRRRIEILEEMAKLLYREWFVHFRFPGYEDVEVVDSDLGPIPEGWEVSRVSDFADLVRGRSYRREELVEDGGFPFLNLKCIDRGGGFRKSGLKRYIGKFKDSQQTYPGDTVIAVTDMTQERNIVAQAGRVPTLDTDFGIISLDLARVLPSDSIDPDFLYGMFRFSSFSETVKEHANGTNVLHLSPDRISEHRFIEPGEELQRLYGEMVRPIFRLADKLTLQNEILSEARDLLLPRLVSGELDVSEIDFRAGGCGGVTPGRLSEDALVERPAMRLLSELGWEVVDGFDEDLGPAGTLGRDSPVRAGAGRRLSNALRALNPGLPKSALDDAAELLVQDRSAMERVRANREVYALLREGAKVEVAGDDGERQMETVRFVDWDRASANDWLAVSQFWILGDMYNRRADVVLFVNGIPLVLVELKVSHKTFVTRSTAICGTTGTLFRICSGSTPFVMLSNGGDTLVGSTFADWGHFAEWKKINSEGEQGVVSLETALKGTCQPQRLLDLVGNFVAFMERPGGLAKALAKNHQFFGVNNSLDALREVGRRRAGWGCFGTRRGLASRCRCFGSPRRCCEKRRATGRL